MRTLFVVAGEVSGDLLAAPLIEVVRRRDPQVRVVGVGGAKLAAAGCELLHDSTTWGVIGYVDPLLRLRTYLRRLRAVEADIHRAQPQVLLLVDFPAFNLRLAERLRRRVPIVYYFPPLVSVRKGDRAAMVARLGMRLLATLRREEAAYRRAGADVVFIGHPIIDLAVPRWPPQQAREVFAIPLGAPVVGLLPGSREQEIRQHLRLMLDAAGRVRTQAPDVHFVIPVAASALRPLIEPAVRASGLPAHVVDEPYDAMALSTVLVTATGTATLEAAILGVPMVAVYRLPWPGMVIARRLVSVRHAALPNILAGREIVPELLQERMTPEAIAAEVLTLLHSSERRETMRAALRGVVDDLGPPRALDRAASEVLRVLEGGVA
ncbi:MAG TPA: lipid-A-disaccharide synthase [bacterium]|nr:lipid-A-disaccharide synthase [bacterium]